MDVIAESRTVYIIDTCSLIAMAETYPMDVFPGVWDKVDEMVEQGLIISAEDVLEELSSKDDDVHQWAKVRSHIFKELDNSIQQSAIEILESHANLLDLKNNKSSADPFLIATARVYGGAVVTEEDFSGGPDKSKIPDVCRDYKVDCVDLLEMLRREELKL